MGVRVKNFLKKFLLVTWFSKAIVVSIFSFRLPLAGGACPLG